MGTSSTKINTPKPTLENIFPLYFHHGKFNLHYPNWNRFTFARWKPDKLWFHQSSNKSTFKKRLASAKLESIYSDTINVLSKLESICTLQVKCLGDTRLHLALINRSVVNFNLLFSNERVKNRWFPSFFFVFFVNQNWLTEVGGSK